MQVFGYLKSVSILLRPEVIAKYLNLIFFKLIVTTLNTHVTNTRTHNDREKQRQGQRDRRERDRQNK